ncbi:MAG TPA: choice-of-anchor tandem repeat GloVer-containing protein [Candidatus Binataceae bacterium]|nr:choice-of-anchor tandem repeat GloVer-containing protein [Candidatus Binataceae bacterium]
MFALTPPVTIGGTWTETVLHSFAGSEGDSNDGAYPQGLLVAANGTLYGTTGGGGLLTFPACDTGCGTVFALAPPAIAGGAWSETILHSFSRSADDGVMGFPGSNLVADANGVLYGTTSVGGAFGQGTVFSVTP